MAHVQAEILPIQTKLFSIIACVVVVVVVVVCVDEVMFKVKKNKTDMSFCWSFRERVYHFEGEAEEENGVVSSFITTGILTGGCIAGCWNNEFERCFVMISSWGIITYSSCLFLYLL